MKGRNGPPPLIFDPVRQGLPEDFCDPEVAVRERLEHMDMMRELRECRRKRASRVYSKMMSLVGRYGGELG
jgi:hypothetical protein